MAQRQTFSPGVYSLQNNKSGTVIDLSAANSKDLIGYPTHGGINQQWKISVFGAGFCIQSVANSDCFISLAAGLEAGDLVVGSPFPVSWEIKLDEAEDSWRIIWPNSNLCFDLEGHGSDLPGAKVLLSERDPRETSQLWRVCETHCNSSQVPAQMKGPVLTEAPADLCAFSTHTNVKPINEGDNETKAITTTVTTTRIRADASARSDQTGILLVKEYMDRNAWVAVPISLLALALSLQKH